MLGCTVIPYAERSSIVKMNAPDVGRAVIVARHHGLVEAELWLDDACFCLLRRDDPSSAVWMIRTVHQPEVGACG